MPLSRAMALDEYEIEPFTHNGFTHAVYHRGSGPCVLVAPEIPGITPTMTAFADKVVAAGMSVAVASLFGTPGKPSSPGRATAMKAQYEAYVKLGGGDPQLVGCVVAHEQRPSPPASRDASMAASMRCPMSPGVLMKTASQTSRTFAPLRPPPWIA